MGADVDPARVRALGLATFDGEKGATGEENQQAPGEKREAAGTKKEAATFILSEALPVIPAKLVKRILKGEFVDMADLLKDNMEAERRRALVEGESNQILGRREVPDILSWLHCFSLYAAVVGSRYPEKSRELLAYQAMLIGEHRRCGGRGWLLYDTAFRQQIVSLETTDFSKLNQSLYATTFLAYGGKGQFCPSCMLPDHTQDECALHPSRTVPVVRLREAGFESREGARGQDTRKQATKERGVFHLE